MSTRNLVPCLWFDHQAESASAFYTQTFPQSRVVAVARYPESFDNPSGKPRGSVLTVEFELAGQRFTALNGGPMFTINPSVSLFVHVDSASEVDRLYAALVDGGKALMPLGTYPWSERYAWVKDRFGVSFQLIAGPRGSTGASVVPCLMFAGKQRGRAFEALQFYSGVFRQGRVDRVERYAAGEGPEGTVKHARVVLAGQELVLMDSGVEHDATFNEGISLQVMCADQAEVDHYWAALSEGGEPSQCGWLKDRFGVSWQVVPTDIPQWMASEDRTARERAFAAILGMKKPDIAALQAAFDGR